MGVHNCKKTVWQQHLWLAFKNYIQEQRNVSFRDAVIYFYCASQSSPESIKKAMLDIRLMCVQHRSLLSYCTVIIKARPKACRSTLFRHPWYKYCAICAVWCCMTLFITLPLHHHHHHGLQTHEDSIPNSLQPKFKSQSQLSIWDVDIKT